MSIQKQTNKQRDKADNGFSPQLSQRPNGLPIHEIVSFSVILLLVSPVRSSKQ